MRTAKKILAATVICIFLVLLLVGFLALSEPYDWRLPRQDLINQSQQPDLIVTVSENYLNSIIKSELEMRDEEGVKNVTIFLDEGAPAVVAAVLQIPLGFTTLELKVSVEANVSAENNMLKVTPESLGIGMMNLPRSAWIGPLGSAMDVVEDALNRAALSVLQKGYRITGVHIGDRYITLAIIAPPPEELSILLL